MMSSNGNIFRITGPVQGEPSQKPVTRSVDVFFIRPWTKGWANNRDAGDLRRHRDHYDDTVMHTKQFSWPGHIKPYHGICLSSRFSFLSTKLFYLYDTYQRCNVFLEWSWQPWSRYQSYLYGIVFSWFNLRRWDKTPRFTLREVPIGSRSIVSLWVGMFAWMFECFWLANL